MCLVISGEARIGATWGLTTPRFESGYQLPQKVYDPNLKKNVTPWATLYQFKSDAQPGTDFFNYMALAFPGTIEDIVDTTSYNRILLDMEKAFIKKKYEGAKGRGPQPVKFKQVGNYEVFYSNGNIDGVISTAEGLLSTKEFSDFKEGAQKQLIQMKDFYPGWGIVVIKWHSTVEFFSQPIEIHWNGFIKDDWTIDFPNKYHTAEQIGLGYFPALDNGDKTGYHSGQINPESVVRRHHILGMGTTPEMNKTCDVKQIGKPEFSQNIPSYLPRHFIVEEHNGNTYNGDFFFSYGYALGDGASLSANFNEHLGSKLVELAA
jgi:hypothetical protein